MRIRKAKRGDLRQVAEIFRVGYSKKPYNERWSKEAATAKIKDHYSCRERTIFVAVECEVVLGFAVLERDRWPGGMGGWLEEIVVPERYRGIGVGTSLMEKVLDHCRRKKFKGMWLAARPRAKAWGWYRKFGFEYDGYKIIGKYFRYRKGDEG